MILRINKKNIATLILYLIIGQVIIFRFFNIHELFNKIILAAIVLLIVLGMLEKSITISLKQLNYPLFLFVILIILNGFYNGINDIYRSNVLMLIYSLMYVAYVAWYVKAFPQEMLKIMYNLRYAINIYMLINILVMIIQRQGNYFLVGFSNWENPAYWDLISGLFGYSTTHVAACFSVFVLIFDLVLIKNMNPGKTKTRFSILVFVLFVLMFWIYFSNDNVGFYIILPVTLVYWIAFSYDLKKVSRIGQVLFLLLLVLIGALFVVLIIPGAYEYLYDAVIYKITGMFESAGRGTDISHGSMERLAQVVYGLNNLDGWKFGAGLNKGGLFHNDLYGFAHFGNASAGGLTCLSGIWSLLFLSMAFAKFASGVMETRHHRFILFAGTIYMLILSFYTTLFTDISVVISVIFIALAFWYAENTGATDK